MSNLSRKTFIEQVNNGELKRKKHIIYHYLMKQGDSTLDQLRMKIPMPHQTITARLSELMDEGMVWQRDNTDEFFITDPSLWDYYADLRMIQKREKWLALGKKNGWI